MWIEESHRRGDVDINKNAYIGINVNINKDASVMWRQIHI